MNYWGFVLDLDQKLSLRHVKPAVVRFIKKIPLDHKAYLFEIGHEKVPERKAEAMARLVLYQGEDFRLGDALRNTAYILASDLNAMYYTRHVVAITDRFTEEQRFRCQTAINVDRRDALDTQFHIYEIGCDATLQNEFPVVHSFKNITEFNLGDLDD